MDFTYKSPKVLTTISTLFIGLTLLLSLASLYGSITEWNIYSHYEQQASFDQLSQEDKDTLAIIVAGADLLKTLFFILSIVFFLMWTYRVHRNGNALKLDGIVNAPGWSVTVYFIPLVNVLMPLITLLHLHKSGTKRASEQSDKTIKPRNWVMYAWWVLFWGSYLVSLPASFGSSDDTIGELREQLPFFMVSETFYFLAGMFLIWTIRKVTSVQEIAAGKTGKEN
ncbi:DUF4328 domain-containing protein [Alteribacillus iranensis]|uniref:DUF4328 domain-containing protein n=1 Tax=Alteribacillus iranensis TaxID=930128 RepID=A0A1I2CV81_9BACI|nr:DUF4328 domain-containing protein [Alteribacillus iranensis]SFE71630.1 protein of unknown function [Alteribacillus iranensis]